MNVIKIIFEQIGYIFYLNQSNLFYYFSLSFLLLVLNTTLILQ